MISKSKQTIQKQTPIFAKLPFMKKVSLFILIGASAMASMAQISKSDLAGQLNTVTTMVPF